MPRALFIFQRIFGPNLHVDEGSGLGQVPTGDILLEDEEIHYLAAVQKVFATLPKVITDPANWKEWYTEHQDLYQEYQRIHDIYHPPGKESQAYVGVERQ